MIEDDIVECVLGLGPNLFYNSPMEACVLICNMNKPKERKNKILFINAVNEVRKEKTMSYMDKHHRDKIEDAYIRFEDIENFCKVEAINTILDKNKGNLNVQLYARPKEENQDEISLEEAINNWEISSKELQDSFKKMIKSLEEVKIHG